mmetsp:Transcript_38617/g.97226  ORF Transcript_38617/g.97226 Transcript_38617/m.97226 type:complete len:121 (-) Transcript_38617:91-453(-)
MYAHTQTCRHPQQRMHARAHACTQPQAHVRVCETMQAHMRADMRCTGAPGHTMRAVFLLATTAEYTEVIHAAIHTHGGESTYACMARLPVWLAADLQSEEHSGTHPIWDLCKGALHDPNP